MNGTNASNSSLARFEPRQVTPIDSLPFEILSKILFECIKEIIEGKPARISALIGPRNQPHSFKLVSKFWKDVAEGTSSLWSHISAPPYNPLTYRKDPYATSTFVSTWLNASKSLPLHVYHPRYELQIREMFFANDPQIHAAMDALNKSIALHRRQMLDLFVAHEQRWESLQISFTLSLLRHFTSKHLFAGHKVGERLSRLKISLDDWNITLSKVNKLFRWIAALPVLRHLELDDPHNVAGDFTLVPWRTLTRVLYRRRFLTFEDSFWLLRQCTSATDITLISGHGSNPRWPLPTPPTISVPYRLEATTKLVLWGLEFPLDLLKRLSLPRLECLEITSCFSTCLDPGDALSCFLDQSQCRLRRFVVSDLALAEWRHNVYSGTLSSLPPMTVSDFSCILEALQSYKVGNVLFRFKHHTRTVEEFQSSTGLLRYICPLFNLRVWMDDTEKARTARRPHIRFCVGWEES
ncbi:hypothetical protein JR316_0012256 [Psilocybe cubensis]|uniref:Uncharacterized protein n=2 Tax=Psilocybe cubensis TaxID=181762 RepID=A0ACB8GJC9_PSICU|nr:hypothetical protein JR316_0012256 [Psilocybe cubensis]KAH9475145.1 hypothetical protein JR316_0012256 [Psilocybe cubensis]